MPDFDLTEREARAIALYLRAEAGGPTLDIGGIGQADPDRGRWLIGTKGCLACHELRSERNLATAPSLAQLQRTSWDAGCLARGDSSRGSAPDFDFGDDELSAIRAFAESDWTSLRNHVASEAAARRIDALRCNACHSRDLETNRWSLLASDRTYAVAAAHIGGEFIEEGRSEGRSGDLGAVSGSEDEGARDAVEEVSIHLGRPSLTWTGEKLRPEWIERFLSGDLDYRPRPRLPGRMPRFPLDARLIAEGLASDHGFPPFSPEPEEADPLKARLGERLIATENGFNCLACHPAGDQEALAGPDTSTIDFVHVTERLRKPFYERFMLDPQRLIPGTQMPQFVGKDGRSSLKDVLGGDAHGQFEAIWHYLLSLQNR